MASDETYVSPFIPDGYTLAATIPAVAGHWSAVRIRYRPMSADEESEIAAKLRVMPNEPMVRWYAESFAAGKLLDWDLKDCDGKKLAITEANLRRLSPQFFDVLKSYLDGTQTGEQEKN